MRVIQLHKIGRIHRPDSAYLDTDDVGENEQAQAQPVVESSPVAINVDAIRCFYQRHAERGPGTRITFKDGGGFAVTELYDEVLQQVISQ